MTTGDKKAEPWRSWPVPQWNQSFLDHFFGHRPDEDGPVVVLLVTAEELARVAQAPIELAEDVRDAFVACVRQKVRRKGDLIDDATDYPEWDAVPARETAPRFIAHLLFTCLAAAESDDELADEGSFILRLRKLTENQLPDASLKHLPTLWRNLAAWLALNSRRYRALALPDLGGLTRIGHTTKLAFPDRRDQVDLARLLHENGFSGAEPPLRLACQLVSENRARFGRRFLASFEEFRNQMTESPRSPTHREHRFWAAVRAASLRGRSGPDATVEGGARVQLLGEVQEDRLAFFLAAVGPINTDHLCSVPLPYELGDWKYAVQLRGAIALDSATLHATVASVLSGVVSIAPLETFVAEGVLPFVEDVSGLLRHAASDELEDARVALVRDDLVPDFTSLFSGPTTSKRSSSHPGWTEVHDARLRRLPASALEHSRLHKCWQLYDRPLLSQVRVLGGVRVEDGRLGFVEMLPSISAVGATSVNLVDAGGHAEPLIDLGGGKWSLPAHDMLGRFELVVDFGTLSPCRRELALYAAPVSDRYIAPADASGWMVEGFNDSDRLGDDSWMSPTDTGLDAASLCERSDLLGPVVGEFVERTDAAALQIIRFAGRTLGTCIRPELCSPPTGQVADAGARRRWRKLLRVAQGTGPEFETGRRNIGGRLGILPTVERAAAPPAHPTDAIVARSAPRVDRLVAILAGVATNRAGLPWGEWRDLVVRVLAPPAEHVAHVMRAWEEVACVDVASLARWRSLVVFARPPRLVAVRAGHAWRATLLGLALPSTIAELEKIAADLGVLVEPRASVSPLVPGTRTLRALDASLLQRVAERVGIELRWLDLAFTQSPSPPRGRVQPPPTGYEWSTPWTRGVGGAAFEDSQSMTRSFRTGCPDYWTVCNKIEQAWTYHPNLACCWAAAFANKLPFEVDRAELLPKWGYVPLPLARVASVLAAALPGPEASGATYRYPLGHHELATFVAERTRSAFSSTARLVSTATVKE